MPDHFALTIEMRPTPQQRLICSCVPTRSGKAVPRMRPDTRAGRNYKPWRKQLENLIHRHWVGRETMNGPLRVRLVFVVPRPKTRPTVSKTSTRKSLGGTVKIPNPRQVGGHFIVSKEDWKRGQRVPSPVKPDVDRFTNAIFDALTECRVWWDDAQVADLHATKWYAAVGEAPSIRLRVEPM